MTKINKPAGFWIRFLTRLIDLAIFLAIVIGTAFAFLSKSPWHPLGDASGNQGQFTPTSYHFESVGNYYGWLAISIVSIGLLFILIPMLTNGRTLAMLICRIKIVIKEEDKTKPWIKRFFARFTPLFKREIFMSLAIAINMLLVIALFDKDLFNKFTYWSKKNLEKHDLAAKDVFSSLDSLRIGIITTVASVLFVVEMIFALSIIVRKNKGGFQDSLSKTKTIWEKRMVELKQPKDDSVTSFKPRLVKKEQIEWIE